MAARTLVHGLSRPAATPGLIARHAHSRGFVVSRAVDAAGARLAFKPPRRPASSGSARPSSKPHRRRVVLRLTLALAPGLALLSAGPVRLDDGGKRPTEINAASTDIDGLHFGASTAGELHVTQAEIEDEHDRQAQSRVAYVFEVYFWEPLLTARRFVHLALLFLPVIITIPVLLLEAGPLHIRSRQLDANGKPLPYKERATTRLWYRLLVAQMERAGPTFIKVRCALFRLALTRQLAQWAGSRRSASSQPRR